MDSDEMLAAIITRAAAIRPFEDWADVLTNYTACLREIECKLDKGDMDRLLDAGADFYCTLARAEAYRRNRNKLD